MKWKNGKFSEVKNTQETLKYPKKEEKLTAPQESLQITEEVTWKY